MKPSTSNFVPDVSVPCTCGGTVAANGDGAIAHTLPTCPDYDAVRSIDDATEYLRRVRFALEAS